MGVSQMALAPMAEMWSRAAVTPAIFPSLRLPSGPHMAVYPGAVTVVSRLNDATIT